MSIKQKVTDNEQKVTGNEQEVMNNEQKVISKEQNVTNNEVKVTSLEYFKIEIGNPRNTSSESNCIHAKMSHLNYSRF